jgi:hypothetical protein
MAMLASLFGPPLLLLLLLLLLVADLPAAPAASSTAHANSTTGWKQGLSAAVVYGALPGQAMLRDRKQRMHAAAMLARTGLPKRLAALLRDPCCCCCTAACSFAATQRDASAIAASTPAICSKFAGQNPRQVAGEMPPTSKHGAAALCCMLYAASRLCLRQTTEHTAANLCHYVAAP